jgi:hypothetical protein
VYYLFNCIFPRSFVVKQVKSVIFAALAAGLFAASAFAQTQGSINLQSIPTPASSSDSGGRAVVGFTVPVPISQAQVQQMVNEGVAAGTHGAYQSWTTLFLGRTLNWNAGRFGQTVTVNPDGTVTTAGWGRSSFGAMNVGFALGYEPIAYSDPYGRAMVLVPTGHDAFGTPPTGFSWYHIQLPNCMYGWWSIAVGKVLTPHPATKKPASRQVFFRLLMAIAALS